MREKTLKNKVKAALLTLIIQIIIAASFFIGFLGDPLIGIIVEGIYFFLIGPFFIYSFFSRK